MEEVVKHKVFYILVWHIGMLTINVIANTLVYIKSEKSKLLYAYMTMQLAIMIWIVAKILKTVSFHVDLRWFFIVFQYFGICLLEVSFLNFAYIYRYKKQIHQSIRWFLYCLAFLQFMIVATNPYHFLFYSRYEFAGDDFGPLFYIHMGILYLEVGLGFYYCLSGLKKKYTNPIQYMTLLSAILIPIVFNVLYLLRISKRIFRMLGIAFSFDITPIAFSVSVLLFVYAIFKQDLLDVLPLMKEEVIHYLGSPIIYFNNQDRIVAYNEQASSIYNINEENNLKKSEVLCRLKEIDTSFEVDASYYQVDIQKVDHKWWGQIGWIAILNDVTSYEKLKLELENNQKIYADANFELREQNVLRSEMVKVKVENFIARELHDVLGHGLVLLIKLLEVAKEAIDDNKELARDSVREAIEILKTHRQAFSQSVLQKKRADRSITHLKYELIELKERFEKVGVNIELNMNEGSKVLDGHQYETVKRVVQEGLTNALKHGKANQVYITFQCLKNDYGIYIADNGLGGDPETLTLGSGLITMQKRMAELGGTMTHTCHKGSGFVLYFQWPIG